LAQPSRDVDLVQTTGLFNGPKIETTQSPASRLQPISLSVQAIVKTDLAVLRHIDTVATILNGSRRRSKGRLASWVSWYQTLCSHRAYYASFAVMVVSKVSLDEASVMIPIKVRFLVLTPWKTRGQQQRPTTTTRLHYTQSRNKSPLDL
jgi:hypothetical protein